MYIFLFIFFVVCLSFQVLKALLEKGENPNKILGNGDPAIFTAIDKGYKDVLQILTEGIVS